MNREQHAEQRGWRPSVARESQACAWKRLGRFGMIWGMLLVMAWATGCTPTGDTAIPTFVLPTARPTTLPQVQDDYSAAKVTRGTMTVQVEVPGRVEAGRVEELYFSVEGLVRAVHKEPGERVAAGERIAELDTYSLDREVLQRASELRVAELNLAQVEEQAAMAQRLAEIAASLRYVEAAIAQEQVGVATSLRDLAQAHLAQMRNTPLPNGEVRDTYSLERDVVQRESELQIAELNLSQVQNQAAMARLQATSSISLELRIAEEQVALATSLHELAQSRLDGAVVTAPFAGTLTSLSHERGSQVKAYEVVGAVADTSEIRILAWVPVNAMEGIAVGNTATVALAQQPALAHQAVIFEIAPEAMVHEGVWAHEVTLAWAPEGADANIPPTLPLEITVWLEGETMTDVLLIPSAAITTFAGQTFVNVVQSDGSLRSVPIQVGMSDAAQTVVFDGLEEGQVVSLP